MKLSLLDLKQKTTVKTKNNFFFCFLCYILEAVSGCLTSCVISWWYIISKQKLKEMKMLVFTNECESWVSIRPPPIVNWYKLLNRDLLGSRWRKLKQHALEDKTQVRMCVRWGKISFLEVNLQGCKNCLISIPMRSEVNNSLQPHFLDGGRERPSCSFTCSFSSNMIQRLAGSIVVP